ncbi:type I-E CRISPR-associated protein Cse2/CasB [Actinomyces sp. 2119]|uniref:type I-E CRISPR-associated protein Cse2/CasB n=1 Tax=Actinomyces sp. 2119 TaxID=2321393 RepID=UPI000E6BBC69|nr:type I-E CRISPR-associated protein Cse2/CasB [Actinomyces sp. 2119]RJF44812.1 type I-E CRISPR-associated protein Cse2/CasB [Actinomyces sp. 2119]
MTEAPVLADSTTPPQAPPQRPRGKGERLASAVAAAASGLQDAYLGRRTQQKQAEARRILATLRRRAGMTADNDPLAWQAALEELLPNLDEDLLGGDEVSPYESAAFAALCLFALHMQSQTAPMHVTGQSLARAVGHLDTRRESSSIKPRFDAVLLCRNPVTRLHHLRNLVTLLRTEHIGADYGRLAVDLRLLELPDRNRVLLRWGRDFSSGHYTTPSQTSTADTTTADNR